ncbi:MAG TPA: hypothetical protein PLA39_09585 [Methanoculleus sp.]|nr:hypothetical protein [Methanoculleus sp.]
MTCFGKKAKPTGYTDTEIWWTCPECGRKNFGIYYSHTSPCAGCDFEHPPAGEVEDSAGHDEALRLKAVQDHKSRIANLRAIRDDRLCEASELEAQIAIEERELRALQLRPEIRRG